MVSRWKFFSESEVAGLNEQLVYKLDKARELVGFPIVITSGLRSVQQNKEAGGTEDSSHLLGLAVDIHMPVGKDEREKLIWALGRCGFKRIGLYQKHAHVDIDPMKSQDVAWFGSYGNA